MAGPPIPVVDVRGLSKSFGRTRALDAVDLSVAAGEIHGLLGQNGSGKSTLIKILSGYHAPDAGELRVNGEPVALPLAPGGARRLGVAFVHQDLALVDSLSVLLNLRVGRYRTGVLHRISWRRERAAVRTMLDRFGLRFDPDQDVSTLRDVDRALLAIVRAVWDIEQVGERGLLVLDEPTVYLPRDSIDRLFEVMREVAASGKGILFVSHQLGEVQAITDRITVLRDGAVVGERVTADVQEDELVDLIVGRKVGTLYPQERPDRAPAERALTVTELSGGLVSEISFEVRHGETLGLTGLVGMGFEDVPYLLFGARPATGGRIQHGDGGAYPAHRASPRLSLAKGMILVPANRLRDGVATDLTVAENVRQPVLRTESRHGVLRLRRLRARVRDVLARYSVNPPDPDAPIGRLSGGNQQKAVIGKWLQVEPSILLLHEPTQGVDVGARKQIFGYVREAADAGNAILLASSEHEDLAHLCDRVLVIRNGRIICELKGDDLTAERILDESFRARPSGNERSAA